jgi:hypothetical protein
MSLRTGYTQVCSLPNDFGTAMPDNPSGPLDALQASLQARTDATKEVVSVIADLKRVVQATSPVLSTDLSVVSAVASELRAIADMIHKDPPVARSSVWTAGSMVMAAVEQANAEMEVPSAYERIRDFFWERDNEPATVGAIISATKSSAAAVRQLIYNRRKGHFVKIIDKRSGSNGLVKYKLVELTARGAGLNEPGKDVPPLPPDNPPDERGAPK